MLMRKLRARVLKLPAIPRIRATMSALFKIYSGQVFTPPRTVEDLIDRYPNMIPMQVRNAVLSRQGGRVRASDQLDDMTQEAYVHLSKPATKTGLTPLQNFQLRRMHTTPEHGWKANIGKVITNHVINILRQPGPQRLQYALLVEPGPGSDSVANVAPAHELPIQDETPEDIFLKEEKHNLAVSRVTRFQQFVASEIRCSVTLAGLQAMMQGDSRATIIEDLDLADGDYRKLCDHLRSLWQIFAEREYRAVAR